MTRPSVSKGQNEFLKMPVGSYFFFSSTRRFQLGPYDAITRAGGSSRARNYKGKDKFKYG